MNIEDLKPHAEDATKLLRSIAHPTRLLVLCALKDGPVSVGALQDTLGIDQVPLSQQLMKLRAEGIVEGQRRGNQIFYAIARPDILQIMQSLQEVVCGPAVAAQQKGQTHAA